VCANKALVSLHNIEVKPLGSHGLLLWCLYYLSGVWKW